MSKNLTNQAFWGGFVASIPFVMVIAPFGMMFGLAGTEAGLTLLQVMGFSVIVIAGVAQFAALHLMVENSPIFIVVFTALAVNLRMAMYSASLYPHLSGLKLWKRALVSYMILDQSYITSILHFEKEPEASTTIKFAFFMGTVTPIWPLWYLGTYLGATIGAQIPSQYALDFVLHLAFLAMVATTLRTRAQVVAALTSVLLSLVLIKLPYNTGLLIAAVIAMVAGSAVEKILASRQKASI
jgi:predicted branched-subunit amino acid permease